MIRAQVVRSREVQSLPANIAPAPLAVVGSQGTRRRGSCPPWVHPDTTPEARLAAIARDRLAYQEYLDVRESLDRSINGLYARYQRKDVHRANEKRKKDHKRKSVPKDEEPEEPSQCPAALGLGPDENNTLFVNKQLAELVRTRREWVDQVGAIFEEKDAEQPGRIHGIPQESVFADMEDEIAAFMVEPPKQPSAKS